GIRDRNVTGVQTCALPISEVIGQSHLIGEYKILKRMVDAKQLSSIIFFGPPGTGKTSLAIALCKSLALNYKMLNAVTDKKKDLEIAVEEAKMSGHLVVILRSEEHTSELQSRF